MQAKSQIQLIILNAFLLQRDPKASKWTITAQIHNKHNVGLWLDFMFLSTMNYNCQQKWRYFIKLKWKVGVIKFNIPEPQLSKICSC
jgi:hypothetical protein